MSLETHNFRFLDFVLDPKEKVLYRNGEPVAITPKAFQLLQTLVADHGRIVEKRDLMTAVWGDSFVEDGNLTFTVNLLRKTLGDDRANHRFIETVPRRGYRFTADVTKVQADEAVVVNAPTTDSPRVSAVSGHHPRRRLSMAIMAAVIPMVMASGLWYASSKSAANAPILSAPFALERISENGNVLHAVVSQDGQNVVYTDGIQGKQSIWLRQLATSNNLEILAPDDFFYYGLALSPDGGTLYFNRRPKLIERQGDIYRLPIFGGVPTRIVTGAQGTIGISPDGQKMSFVRCAFRADEYCSLWIADAGDGGNERKLVSRPRPIRISDHEFTPDGRSITFAVGQSENQASEFGLAEVDLESGVEREITRQKFFNIKSIIWLPDRTGMLVTASRVPNKQFHVWRIPADGGDAQSLTVDGASYATLSMDGAASQLVATQIRQNFRLQVYGVDDTARTRVLSDATSVAYGGDGKIVFSSARTGNHEIWSINADGSEQRQLTNDPAEDRTSAVSPDNKHIFFESNRSGEAHVWRMNSDGSDQVQITSNEGGFPISVSPDGVWLYYRSAVGKTLRRVAAAGGDEELVLERRASTFAISPDGTRVAITENKGDTVNLLIISLTDKRTITSIPLPTGTNPWVDLAWTNDGSSVALITRNSEMQNNKVWLQPVGGGGITQIADLGDEGISELSGFAMSPDGSSFAVSIGRWEHDAVLLRGLK